MAARLARERKEMARIAAAVLVDLEARAGGQSCLVTRDKKDFSDPELLEQFQSLHCKVIFSFDDALKFAIDPGEPRV